MNKSAPIDVFLSRKSEDAPLAKQLYDFLTAEGLKVFDSAYSLSELGNADYQRAIDYALETCTHMIVVGSSAENICSPWVDAEWRLFINEKRAGYKAGNILTVVTPEIIIRSLPASLRYYEVIALEQKNFERIFAYVDRKSNPSIEPTAPEETHKPSDQAIADWYAKGEQCYLEKDYAQAVAWYRKAAEQGHAQAQYNLGICYTHGRGIKQDYIEAFGRAFKAAEQNCVEAQYALGVYYCNGNGVQQNYAEAVKWYSRAAAQGDAISQRELGACYNNGDGAQQNYTEAVKWYSKAAAQGDAQAQCNLGAYYESGLGVSQDYSEAVKWYSKAAVQGMPAAQCNLGACYVKGRGVNQDYIRAVEWFKEAAKQGMPEAQFNLGICYELGYGAIKSRDQAHSWYVLAAKSGHVDAKSQLKRLENGSF